MVVVVLLKKKKMMMFSASLPCLAVRKLDKRDMNKLTETNLLILVCD